MSPEMTPYDEYYRLLGLNPGAGPEEVKKALGSMGAVFMAPTAGFARHGV